MDELNEKWNMRKVAEETFKTMHLHDKSAPETRERLSLLELNNKNIMDKLEQSIQDNKEAHNGLIAMITNIETKLDTALEKKAGKWVEKVLIWLGAIVGAGILTYLGSLIIKTSNHLQ